MTIGTPIRAPDGAYWFKDRSGWAIVENGVIVAIVRLWGGALLWRAAQQRKGQEGL